MCKMSTSQAFFQEADPSHFQHVFESYPKVLKEKASKLTKTPKRPRGGKDLLDLDEWYQETLSGDIQGRKEKYITHEELCKLMRWKLIRGKFRPRLTELVQANKEEDVEAASKLAFKKLPKLEEAIKALVPLKAIGPATASAVLAAGAPEHAPFMADEAMLAIPGLQPLDYTLKHYMNYATHIKACLKKLNAKDSSKKWTPHAVEITLWTHYMAGQLGMDLSIDGSTSKRKGADNKEKPAKKKKA